MLLYDLYIQNSDKMTKLDTSIYESLAVNYNSLATFTITDLSKRAYTSTTTIHRFIKKLGFDTFAEFKLAVKNDIKSSDNTTINSNNRYEIIQGDLESTHRMNIAYYDKISDLIRQSENIYFYGTGTKQHHLVEDFSLDLLYSGIKSQMIRNSIDFNVIMQSIPRDSILFILSISGKITDIKDAVQFAKNRDVCIVAITNNRHSLLNKLADYNLFFNNSFVEYGKHWTPLTCLLIFDELLATINDSIIEDY